MGLTVSGQNTAEVSGKFLVLTLSGYYNNNNNYYYYYYLLQLGCHPVAVVILHVNKTLNWLLLTLNREGYMRSM